MAGDVADLAEDVAENVAVCIAGIVAGDVVKVTRSALRLIFSRDPAVAIAVQMQARRRGVLSFLPLFRFLMV
ncbi:MAG: hypothetical protein ACXWQR_07260 [Ktedonobacterales bacterium]